MRGLNEATAPQPSQVILYSGQPKDQARRGSFQCDLQELISGKASSPPGGLLAKFLLPSLMPSTTVIWAMRKLPEATANTISSTCKTREDFKAQQTAATVGRSAAIPRDASRPLSRRANSALALAASGRAKDLTGLAFNQTSRKARHQPMRMLKQTPQH